MNSSGLRKGPAAGSCQNYDDISGLQNSIFWLAEQLVASLERLWSMDFGMNGDGGDDDDGDNNNESKIVSLQPCRRQEGEDI